MPSDYEPSVVADVPQILDSIRAGDAASIPLLLDVAMQRLRKLAKRISADIPGVKRWEQTDDLVQNSMIRLWKALDKHHPATPLDFYRLASMLIRRELIDMSRHHFGPEGIGANHALTGTKIASGGVSPVDLASDDTSDPGKLGDWTEFHEYVESLDDDQRILFDLLWYQGMTLAEAAELTGSSERTIRRRWKASRIALFRLLMEPGHNQ